ncbi:MAG: hypothetical protein LBN06_12240 [Prevotellaceae bacterium]|jgi:tetratricopeptide (TPR) repeat protein|nr:hypothetical protein [Prevotellaceae bacterium]
MRRLFTIAILIIMTSMANAQDYKADFLKYYQKGDTLQQRKVLQAWGQKSPKDAELFTCYSNYYMGLSRQEVVGLTTEQPDGESLVLTDNDGNVAGYMGSTITYQTEMLQKGIDKLNEGIALYPDRLDMRFGMVYLLGVNKQWEAFADNIVKAIQYSARNKNKWTWEENQPFEEGEAGFLSALQDYQVQLFNTNDDALLPYVQRIAQEMLKYYPKHVESLSNLAVTYMIAKQYNEALSVLLKAEQYAPNDTVVLGNIAYCYEHTNEQAKAEKYRQRINQIENQ